jgi:hypothetical protein
LAATTTEDPISDLLDGVLAAHGGLERWNAVTELTADFAAGSSRVVIRHEHGDVVEASVTTTEIDP